MNESVSRASVAAPPAAPAVRRPDLTRIGLHRAIWLLAVPMTLEMAVTSVYQIADLYWVGRLGSEALAAVSVAGMVRWAIVSLSNGLAIGGLAIVARRIGEHRPEAANHATTQAVVFTLVVSLGMALLGLATMRPLLRLLGAGPDVLPLGLTFLRVTYLGLWAIVMVPVINALFRGAGDATIAFGVLAFANLFNVVLEPFMVLGWGPFPRLGVTGAALSMVIAQGLGLGLQLLILLRGRARIRLNPRRLWLDPAVIRRIVEIGTPSTVQMFLRAASRVAVVGLVGMFGTYALAGYGVASRVLLVALIPGFGLGNAAATLVGQNLGAHQPHRAAKSAWIIAGYNVALMSAFALFAFLMAPWLVGLFDPTPAVVAYGSAALRVIAASYLFSALGVVMGRGLDGAGNTVPAMAINALSLWGVQIPLAYLLARADLGAHGIWWGIAVANMANGLLMAFWFRRGGWKRRQV
ncbi:MAG: MATE family efflux transporter [Anaerolineae bacterium]